MNTVKDYLKHPKKFLNALLGRPNPVEAPQASTPAPVGTQPVSPDDPLHQDLEKASSLFKNLTAKLPKVELPIAKTSSTQAIEDPNLAQVSELIRPNKMKKLLPAIIGGVILLVLILIGVFVVVPIISKMRAPKETPVVVLTPSPTPIEQAPTQPSIYANDPEILKLQEDINVLDREVVGTQLRETTLNAPVLDFNVSF